MGKKVILTYLPLKTDFEKKFWTALVNECIKAGYQITFFGNKSFHNELVNEIFIQRNLDEYYFEHYKVIEKKIKGKKSLIGEEVLLDCLNREIVYGQASVLMKKEAFDVLRYFEQLIIEECNNNDIGFIVTWTQLSPISFITRKVGKILHLPVYEAERAPLNDFIWIEKEGIFNEASIWKEKITFDKNNISIGKMIRQDIIHNVYGFRKGNNNPLDFSSNKKIFFLPMDNIFEVGWMPLDYSVSKKRFENFIEPLSFINYVNSWVKMNNGLLVVKLHPSCVYFDTEKEYDFILSKADLKELLEISDYVLCNYTKVAFPALAMRKKFITFSKNIALLSKKGIYVSSIKELDLINLKELEDENNNYDIIDNNMDIIDDYYDIIDNYFGWLARNYFYTCDKHQCKNVKDFVKGTLRIEFGK